MSNGPSSRTCWRSRQALYPSLIGCLHVRARSMADSRRTIGKDGAITYRIDGDAAGMVA